MFVIRNWSRFDDGVILKCGLQLKIDCVINVVCNKTPTFIISIPATQDEEKKRIHLKNVIVSTTQPNYFHHIPIFITMPWYFHPFCTYSFRIWSIWPSILRTFELPVVKLLRSRDSYSIMQNNRRFVNNSVRISNKGHFKVVRFTPRPVRTRWKFFADRFFCNRVPPWTWRLRIFSVITAERVLKMCDLWRFLDGFCFRNGFGYLGNTINTRRRRISALRDEFPGGSASCELPYGISA